MTAPTPKKHWFRRTLKIVGVLALFGILWLWIQTIVFMQVQFTNKIPTYASEYLAEMDLDVNRTYPVYLSGHIPADAAPDYFVLRSGLKDSSGHRKVKMLFVSDTKETEDKVDLEVYVGMYHDDIQHSGIAFDYEDYLLLLDQSR